MVGNTLGKVALSLRLALSLVTPSMNRRRRQPGAAHSATVSVALDGSPTGGQTDVAPNTSHMHCHSHVLAVFGGPEKVERWRRRSHATAVADDEDA